MEYPIIFGILLVATGGNSVACVLYAIKNNIKTPINRVFLALGFAMLFWCLGLAVTVVAANEEICSLGRRLAPMGWGTICSILLHFILLLTQKNNLLKKCWIYLLLYLPSAVTIFAYTFLPLIQLNQDYLIQNELGWINISETDVWDWFYYVYVFTFITISIITIYLWARDSSSDNIKKQVKFLKGSLLLTSLLGSLTDIFPAFLKIRIPQLSPIFVLFPIAAVSYSIRYHGFMRAETENQNELILNESDYTNVYRYIGMIFAFGIIINLIAQFLLNEAFSMSSAVLFSLVLICITAFIFLLNSIKLDDPIKEMLLAAGFSFIIPVVTLWFAPYAGITIWAFIFLLIIVCLLFNRRTILITVIISSILTQLIIWASMPSVLLEVDGTDYMARISLIVVAAILSFYVNNLYVQRLKDNANQISMQMLMAETSYDFVSVSEQNFNDKVYDMLKRCGVFIKSDKAYIALFDTTMKNVCYSRKWLDDGAALQSEVFGESELDRSILLKQFESRNIVKLHDTELMLPMENLKNHLLGRNVRALLAIPIKKQNDIIGIMTFTATRPLIEWCLEPFTYLDIINNIIVAAIIKIDAEKEINFIAYHDQLTHLPNRILFKDTLEATIKWAEENGGMFAVAFLDLDSFKTVNDTMGHELGDQLLFKAARIFSQSIRIGDMIARFGGDEFVILFNDVSSKNEIIKIMDKIMDALRKPILLNDQEFFISVSMGVALYPKDGTDVKTLIRNADMAMYSAKTCGKSQYFLYS